MTDALLTRRSVLAALGAATAMLPLRGRGAGAPPSWSAGPDLPEPIQEIYPAVLDGRVYVAGGLSPAVALPIGVSHLLASWDGAEDTWRHHAPLPVPTHHIALAGLDGRLVGCGGFVAAAGDMWRATDAVHVYDPATERWTAGPPLPGPQAEMVPAVVGSTLHLVGGREPVRAGGAAYGDNGDTARHLVLAGLGDDWHEAAPLPSPRNSAAGAVLSGALHIVGGRTMDGGNLADHLRYDPAGDRWDALTPLPAPRSGPNGAGGLAAAALGNALFAFGGEWLDDGGGVYAQVWRYDLVRDRWYDVGDMPTARHGFGAVTLGNRIITFGGATGPGIAGTSSFTEIMAP